MQQRKRELEGEAQRLASATAVLRHCGFTSLVVRLIRPLAGGMVSRVEEWTTDGTPPAVVVKISDKHVDTGLKHECESLRWFRAQTEFPVPEPYGYVPGKLKGEESHFLMQKLPGHHLGVARLTPAGMTILQRQMAWRLAQLHAFTRDSYGGVIDGERSTRWLDWFMPRIESNFRDAYQQLSHDAQCTIRALLTQLDHWLPEAQAPTLIHGDLWANNIMVDDRDPDHPRLVGFIDGGGLFADVEYELAYLLVFNTADERFFQAYTRQHPLREGFHRRCRVYWLNTMLLHLWMFGTEYRDECERLAAEIQTLL